MSLSGLAQDSSRPAVSELRVNMINMRRALDAIVGNALARKGFTLFTVNLDHMVKLEDHVHARSPISFSLAWRTIS